MQRSLRIERAMWALALVLGVQGSAARALELIECSNANGTLKYTSLKDNHGKVVLPEAYLSFNDTLPPGLATQDIGKATELRREVDAATGTTTVYRFVPVRVAKRGSSPAVRDFLFCKTQLTVDPARDGRNAKTQRYVWLQSAPFRWGSSLWVYVGWWDMEARGWLIGQGSYFVFQHQ